MPQLRFPIRTERLLLRPFVDEDFEVLYAMHGHPEVTRYFLWGPLPREKVRELLDRVKPMIGLDTPAEALRLAAVIPGSGEVTGEGPGTLIGDVSLWRTSREHATAEVGFVIHPDHHGQGYATEATAALLRVGFERDRLHRIVGRCDSRNAGSARVMERLGMRREAHFRQNERIKGEWCDELVYAILANEWKAGGRSCPMPPSSIRHPPSASIPD